MIWMRSECTPMEAAQVAAPERKEWPVKASARYPVAPRARRSRVTTRLPVKGAPPKVKRGALACAGQTANHSRRSLRGHRSAVPGGIGMSTPLRPGSVLDAGRRRVARVPSAENLTEERETWRSGSKVS